MAIQKRQQPKPGESEGRTFGPGDTDSSAKDIRIVRERKDGKAETNVPFDGKFITHDDRHPDVWDHTPNSRKMGSMDSSGFGRLITEDL